MLKKIRFVYVFLAILIALIAYITLNAINIVNYSKIDNKHCADVIIVLGAGTYNDEVSPVFRERINHAMWLYNNGYADKIIMTGGYGEGNEHSDAYVAKMYAVSQGVPETDIFLEEQSTITQENLENAKAIIDENNYRDAIIVSDPLHMKRAMLMSEDYGITAYTSPTPTTMYKSTKTKLAFLARELFFYIGYKVYSLCAY
ncbi:MAG: YdcF family protein [Clostridia bacterium]|nr:YdcF family protein [Clostridia bacterium]